MMMRSKAVVGVVCAVALVILAPGYASPWGWATHTYLVNQLGVFASDAIYGALLPDLGQVMDPTFNDYLHDQTTLRFSKLVGKGFPRDLDETAWGFATHNERWGADYTAHNPDTGYTTLKAPAVVAASGLQQTLLNLLLINGIPPAQAEPLAAEFALLVAHETVEYAVDLMINAYHAPNSGATIGSAAYSRDPGVAELLVRTYATNFAARYRMTIPEASALLTAGEAAWRVFMMQYGGLLDGYSMNEIAYYLALQGSVRLHDYIYGLTGVSLTVNPMILLNALWHAFALTQPDYLEALEAARQLLQRNMSLRIREIE